MTSPYHRTMAKDLQIQLLPQLHRKKSLREDADFSKFYDGISQFQSSITKYPNKKPNAMAANPPRIKIPTYRNPFLQGFSL